MKEFKDLIFENKKNCFSYGMMGYIAKMYFPNNYGVSVISGGGAYTDKDNPYEIAILYNGKLCYTTHITDDVIGYQTEEEVTEVMKQVQEL